MDFKLLGLCTLVVLGIVAIMTAIFGLLLLFVMVCLGHCSPLWGIPMFIVVIGFWTWILYASVRENGW